VPPAASVRKTELEEVRALYEDDTEEPVIPRQSSLAQKLAASSSEQQECCCRQGPCSWNNEQKQFAVQRDVAASTFERRSTPVEEGDEEPPPVLACCENVTKKTSWTRHLWSNCRGGKKLEEGTCGFQERPSSSIDSCADKLTWLFKRDDWYKLLADEGGGGVSETNYKVYVPCLNSKRSHVDDVVIHKLSFFNSGGWANPVRTWVISRPQCSALSERDLKQAIEVSYDQMCAFPLKSANYHPNFQPDRACTFNKSAGEIHFSDTSMCPEGHRCACPIFSQDVKAVNRETWVDTANKGRIRKFLDTMLLGGGVVAAVSAVATVGTLAAVGGLALGTLSTLGSAGATIATFKWAISTASVGTGLLVYGSGYAVQYLQGKDCQAKVGCFPMPCIEEEEEGCRIALAADDESDQRNPYWFMPPPMHKCSANVWGKCRLSVCTAADARSQMVGESDSEYGVFRKKTKGGLFNCQPTLAQDMSHKQIRAFESKVSGLRSEEHREGRRKRIRAANLARFCPHKTPTHFIASALCNDGTMCDIKEVPGPNCCLSRKGVKQCPAKFPILCNDHFCDTEVNNCIGDRGGAKECVAESPGGSCQFLLSALEDDKVLCKSGESFPLSHFHNETSNETKGLCEGEGGLDRCPWNKPVMCANQDCNGEHCCAKSCEEHGGPRRCENLQVGTQAYSGAAPAGAALALLLSLAASALRLA